MKLLTRCISNINSSSWTRLKWCQQFLSDQVEKLNCPWTAPLCHLLWLSVYASAISIGPHFNSFSWPTLNTRDLCSGAHSLLLHSPCCCPVSREVTRYSSSTSCATWPLPPALAQRWVASREAPVAFPWLQHSALSQALNTQEVVFTSASARAVTHTEQRLQNCVTWPNVLLGC